MGQIKCPYCKSIQVKAMANQPKKNPRPSDPAAIESWQRGYDCKKCGNDFVIPPPKPQKNFGFLGKLVKWIIILLIGFFALAYFVGESTPTKNQQNTQKKHNEEIATNESLLDMNIKQDFSQEAEEAAHAYIPTEEDYKNFEQKQSQKVYESDNLTITETIRESE